MRKKIIIFFIISILLLSLILCNMPKEDMVLLGKKVEIIVGVGGLIALVTVLILSIRNAERERSRLNKLEEDPEQRELARIAKSKLFHTPNKDDREKIKIVARLAIFALFLFVVTLAASVFNLNINIIICISLSSYLLLVLLVKKEHKDEQDSIELFIFKLIENKYGKFEIIPTHSKQIVEGDKSKPENIRHNYNLSLKILEYKCTLTNYYREKLEFIRNYDIDKHRGGHYAYIRKKNIFEYCYDLNALGVKSITNDILDDEQLKENIEELSKIKLMNVYMRGNYLIIEKETVLFDYQTEDAERDINDVELFYNKIVKIISEDK